MKFPRLVLLVALWVLASGAAAQTEPPNAPAAAPSADVSACVGDHKLVQTARESGQFLASRDAAARCAQASCPRLIREDCAAWYVELDQHTPSLLLDVRDPRGGDVPAPRVTLGGRALDVHGRAVALDPGAYELRVEAAGFEPQSARILLRQGEKNRRVTLTLDPSAPLPIAKSRPSLSPAVITLGAIGLVGLGTFAALAVVGRLRHGDLDADRCKPSCDRSDVDAVNRMYLGANIAAALGGSAALAAVALHVVDRRRARRLDVALSPFGVSLRGEL